MALPQVLMEPVLSSVLAMLSAQKSFSLSLFFGFQFGSGVINTYKKCLNTMDVFVIFPVSRYETINLVSISEGSMVKIGSSNKTMVWVGTFREKKGKGILAAS